jgi:hypothetical protein
MIEILIVKIQRPYLVQFLPVSLQRVYRNKSRVLVDESRMIRTHMEITTDQKVVAVSWDALYDTTPNSNH